MTKMSFQKHQSFKSISQLPWRGWDWKTAECFLNNKNNKKTPLFQFLLIHYSCPYARLLKPVGKTIFFPPSPRPAMASCTSAVGPFYTAPGRTVLLLSLVFSGQLSQTVLSLPLHFYLCFPSTRLKIGSISCCPDMQMSVTIVFSWHICLTSVWHGQGWYADKA